MGSRHYLPFLRPYLCRSLPRNGSVYRHFYTADFHTSPACNEWAPLSGVDKRRKKLQDNHALVYPRIGTLQNHITVSAFRKKYGDEGCTPAREDAVLCGKIMSVRRSGAKLCFLDLMDDHERVQVMLEHNSNSGVPAHLFDEFKTALRPLLRGDIISVRGRAIRTPSGELTLRAHDLPKMLSPGVRPLPTELEDGEDKALKKHIDWLIDERAQDLLRIRWRVVKSMTDFFDEHGFIGVQTPILTARASGALCRPFLTTATSVPDKQLEMRISPELWLKRLVVGNYNRVFEIGPAFRNEGLDSTHNPEYTMCEFYMAYSNLPQLMSFTEDLFAHLVRAVGGLGETPKVSIPEGPWQRIQFIPALEKALDIKFPDLVEPRALEKLTKCLKDRNLFDVTPGVTLEKLLDQLAGAHLEPASLEQPVFITHHPACMAPLAKSFKCPKTGQLVSARAELFVRGFEVANMYEEENDPLEQRRKFVLQARADADGNGDGKQEQEKGQEQEPPVDESYLEALEYALPPTGGWGCGVDRLVMLLAGSSRIGDTLSFGHLRNVVQVSQLPTPR
ncbi:lysyl-tRNA synthetase-like protein [Xylariaceae sp. FL0804]|nr:lysyl-tRNA synthetase-like protein [Xylariaceae sp. FL0804]